MSESGESYIEDIAEHMAEGSLFNFGSQITYSLIMLVISIAIARILGTALFGILNILLAIQALIGFLSGFNLPAALTKYSSEYRVLDAEKTGRYISASILITFISSIITSLVFFLSASYFSSLYRYEISPLLIQLAILPYFIGPFSSIFFAIIRGYQKMKLHAILQIIAAMMRFVFLVIGALLYGLIGVLIGLGVLRVSFLLLEVFLCKKYIKNIFPLKIKQIMLKRDEIIQLLKFSMPIFIPLISISFSTLFTSTILALNNGYVEVAIFTVAYTLAQSIKYIPRAISIPFFPSVSELLTVSTEKAEILTRRVLTIVTCLAFPISLIFALFPSYILGFLYGIDYSTRTGIYVLIILSGSLFLEATIMPLVDMLLANVRVNVFCLISLSQIFIYIILSIFLIPIFGATGLAISYLISSILYFLLIKQYFSKLQFKITIFPLLLAFILLLTTFGILLVSLNLKSLGLIISLLYFTIVSLFIFWQLRKEGFLYLIFSILQKSIK